MTTLIPIINEVVQYGLQPNLIITDKEKQLEQNLIKIYSLYFEIDYTFDENNFSDFDKSQLPNIRQNVESNFKDFGFYNIILDINNLDILNNTATGDAADDLTDIIIDLLEIKWRITNNSLADGLWYFQLIFQAHTQEHILDLLKFMKHKNG